MSVGNQPCDYLRQVGKILQRDHHPIPLTGTPWIRTGDEATILTFLLTPVADITYTRRWLVVKSASRHDPNNGKDASGEIDCTKGATDAPTESTASTGSTAPTVSPPHAGEPNEAVALDVVLPTSGLDPAKPFYLVLHGLSGGSDEVSYCPCCYEVEEVPFKYSDRSRYQGYSTDCVRSKSDSMCARGGGGST